MIKLLIDTKIKILILYINASHASHRNIIQQIMLKVGQKLPRNFIKTTISSRLKCPICFDVYYKPRRLFCGHTFCKPCILQLCTKNWQSPQHGNTCPLCRTAIDVGKISPDLFATKIINQLQVTCSVFGCPWRGENQLLDAHYKFQCKLKSLVEKVAKGSKEFDCSVQEYQEKDDVVRQKLNENLQKGSLISRVVAKNPQLLNGIKGMQREQSKQSQRKLYKRPKLVTCGTQTYPVKIIPIKRTKNPKEMMLPQMAPPYMPRITPVNGFDPVPAHLLKNKPQNLATRIKQQKNMSLASSAQEMRGIRRLYDEMELDFFDDSGQPLRKSHISAVDLDQQ